MKYKWKGWTSEILTHIISWNSICCIIVVSLSLGRFYPGLDNSPFWNEEWVMWATQCHKPSQTYQTWGWFCTPTHQATVMTWDGNHRRWIPHEPLPHDGLAGVCAAPHPLAKRGSKGWGLGGLEADGEVVNSRIYGDFTHISEKNSRSDGEFNS